MSNMCLWLKFLHHIELSFSVHFSDTLIVYNFSLQQQLSIDCSVSCRHSTESQVIILLLLHMIRMLASRPLRHGRGLGRVMMRSDVNSPASSSPGLKASSQTTTSPHDTSASVQVRSSADIRTIVTYSRKVPLHGACPSSAINDASSVGNKSYSIEELLRQRSRHSMRIVFLGSST